MTSRIEHVPANLVLPGWSVRVDNQWWAVVLVAETERRVGGPRVWIFVRDHVGPLIFELTEEVEVRREDPSSQAK